jgi:hypothetical protein
VSVGSRPGVAVALAAAVLAFPASGVIPKAERIAAAAARANQSASRSQALQLDLTLRVADREPIGTGKLVTHPTGLARLELRDAAGRVERHLLLGTEHSASRNGSELEKPREFLPPLFLLQVDSPATLEQALADYGLDVRAASLAPCGQQLCYVLGDPTRVPPPPAPTPEELAAMVESAPREGFLFDTPANPAPSPTIWIETRTFEIVRIELGRGVSIAFGSVADFGGVRFPGSIAIQEPEREPVRFDVLGVTAVNAPAAGFSRVWLLTPDEDEPRRDGDAPRAPAAPGAPLGPPAR